MKFKMLIATGLVFLYSVSAGQIPKQHLDVLATPHKYLKVGDVVPDFSLNNMVNYHSKSASVSEFKGKLLIFDFWSTSCASCIQSWPKLLDLQIRFAGKIQIVLINAWEDQDKVRTMYARRKKLANIDMILPTSCKDSTILNYIKVFGLPHVVWIGKMGSIKAITAGDLLNAENIESLLKDENLNLQEKIDPDRLLTMNSDRPLFLNGNGGTVQNDVLSYSILTKGGQGIPSSVSIMPLPKGNMSTITCTNIDIKHLYSWAYSNRTTVDGVMNLLLDNRISLKVKDTTKYIYKINGEIQFQNLYNYQFLSPGASAKTLQERMQSDLHNVFGLRVRWIKKKVKSLVIQSSDTLLISYKTGTHRCSLRDGIKINKMLMSDFVKHLEDATDFHYSRYPIIDETEFKGLLGNIELAVDGYGGDHIKLSAALNPYKITLTLQDRYVDVLEIAEPDLE